MNSVERPIEQLLARASDARGEGVVDVDDPAEPIEHRDQVRDRVERVLELALRPHDVVEQLQVFDGVGQLASELVGAVEQIELAARLDAHAFEHDRPERAAAAAKRHRHRGR